MVLREVVNKLYTFDARHYRLEGYKALILDGREEYYWIFRDKTALILMHEAKYVNMGNVYFLKRNGTYETRAQLSLELG